MRRSTEAPVSWSGTFLGLQPTLADGAPDAAAEDLDDLVTALDDDATFVAAHVLLTRLTGVAHETSPTWNGLVVELRADGTAVVDPGQRRALAARWRRWARAEPRPDRLSDLGPEPEPDERDAEPPLQ